MLAEEAEGAQLSNEWEALVKARFLKDLFQFMDSKYLPIERIPQLGFKELDLFLLYKTVQKLGGFDLVTEQQKWKQVYAMLGADPRSTSAATSTRRHYERLLLPYDRHLIQKTLPPSLKRPLHHSPSLQDEEGLRGSKRSAVCRHPNPTLTQELSSLAQREVIDRLKQIGSSSVCEQPLNLSCWGGGRDPAGRRLPSFTPPTDKKVPKFLNRVSSLYQAWCLQEGNVYRLPGNLPTREAEQTHLEFKSISVQEEIIDLTSDISPSSSPPTKTYLYPPLPLSSTCGPLDISVNKTQEQKHPLHTGEVPFKLNHSFSNPSATSVGQMQTEFVQPLLKDRFRVPAFAMEAVGVITSSGKQWCQQGVMEPRPTKHGASELGFSFRDSDTRSSFRESVRWNGSTKGEENLRSNHWASLCESWQGRKPVSGRYGDARWPQPWCRDPKDMRPFHEGWLEAQELLVARRCPGAWPTSSARYLQAVPCASRSPPSPSSSPV